MNEKLNVLFHKINLETNCVLSQYSQEDFKELQNLSQQSTGIDEKLNEKIQAIDLAKYKEISFTEDEIHHLQNFLSGQEELIAKLNFSLVKQLPLMMQSEMSECGLACLAMIASSYGFDTNLSALRQRFPVSSRGMDLQQMVELASSLKLDSRALRLELDELDQLHAPCILHWDLNHFVVLKKVTKKGAIIHDPAIGVRTLTFDQISKSFTGVALEIYPSADFVQAEEKRTISLYDFWRSLKGIKKSLIMLFCITLVLQFWALINPLLMRFIVDDVIIYKDVSLLTSLCLGFSLLTVFSTATSVLRSMFLLYLTKSMSLQVQNALFGRLIRLPLSYFIKRQTGDIMSRFGSLQAIQNLVTTTFVESSLDGIMVIFSLSMMILYSLQLTLVTIVALSLYILLRAATLSTFKELNEEMIVAGGQERSVFLETLHSIQPIKLFHKEHQRQGLWQNKLANAYNVGIKTEQFSTSYAVINKMIFSIENIIILYLCTKMIINPKEIFSLGMMYAFLQYKGQFTGAISSLVDNFFQVKMMKLHLERLADIALEDTDPCFDDKQRDKLTTPIKGSIRVSNLSFRYDAFEPLLFQNLNFEIKEGESVALIGPSGCGKSTLMKILIGLLESTSGDIFIDDIKLADRQLAHYRESIASVMQNDSLLAGSIRENIAFFDENINDQYVEYCAQLAAIDQDIKAMPMGYHTLVGELGSQISGGQQQRILLARALYKKPRILFLDEATSHLDLATEHAVSTAIAHLNITRVIIAHRPETIKTADRLLVLQAGNLVEQGKSSS